MAARVAIVEYDPRWPGLFEAERARLAGALAPYALAIEHIGSTAVPGLASKPTIDMAVGLARLWDAPRCIERMERLGYEYLAKFENVTPERRYFRKGRTDLDQASHQVHMTEIGSDFWDRDILFRDWLRGHPQDAAAYAALKRELASTHGADREGYTEAKTPFVRAIQAQALEERAKASDLRTRRAAGAGPPPAPPGGPRPPSSPP
jgi:GrpB-like predicted nucleotidyltransferase (UPF0157 family)